MTSPGLEAPHPRELPENPTNIPLYRPKGLTYRFPEGWTITVQVSDGAWSAEKDSRFLTHPTEGGLFALVIASERQRALRDL